MNVTVTEPLWAALAAEGVEYALVGGLAMLIHGPASLHWMKASTVRPIDAQDAERLRQAFDL